MVAQKFEKQELSTAFGGAVSKLAQMQGGKLDRILAGADDLAHATPLKILPTIAGFRKFVPSTCSIDFSYLTISHGDFVDIAEVEGLGHCGFVPIRGKENNLNFLVDNMDA